MRTFRFHMLLAAVSIIFASTSFGATVTFDEFTSPPVTCCFGNTLVIGPLVYPDVTITDGGNKGYVMNSTGWDNMQTSGGNLFGTLSGTISLTFNSPTSNLILDVINGGNTSNFSLSLYGSTGLIASYNQFLNTFGSAGSVGNFAPPDAGITSAVITGNSDFGIDTVRFQSNAVPEPATFGLLGGAIAGLGLLKLRRRL